MTWKIESFTDVDGNKDKEFLKFIDLPRRTPHRFELAVNGPQQLLREHGWDTVDAMGVSRSLWDYREFIQGSHAEFGVAKHAYVAQLFGLVQRPHRVLPRRRPPGTGAGHGVERPSADRRGACCGSRPCEEALDGLDRIVGDWTMHSKRAAEIAREHFDAGAVLPRFLETACA